MLVMVNAKMLTFSFHIIFVFCLYPHTLIYIHTFTNVKIIYNTYYIYMYSYVPVFIWTSMLLGAKEILRPKPEVDII